jgi:hypothetical protein
MDKGSKERENPPPTDHFIHRKCVLGMVLAIAPMQYDRATVDLAELQRCWQTHASLDSCQELNEDPVVMGCDCEASIDTTISAFEGGSVACDPWINQGE